MSYNKNIDNFLKDHPWIENKINFFGVDNFTSQKIIMSYYDTKSKKLNIAYSKKNPEWIFHELGHIAALTNHKDLYLENYGYEILNQYSVEAVRHEANVFAHQVNFTYKYSKYNIKSLNYIRDQIGKSLPEGINSERLKLIIPNFLKIGDFNQTINRIKFHLDKMPK